MSTSGEYLDIKEVADIVTHTLRSYTSLHYSRLLMMTKLPQDILDKALGLLEDNQVIIKEGTDDPSYSIAARGWARF